MSEKRRIDCNRCKYIRHSTSTSEYLPNRKYCIKKGQLLGCEDFEEFDVKERCKYHYTFSITHNIATIYEDDMILCKDILIEEKTLDKVIDKLNELAEENEQLREKVKDYEVILSIANSNDVLCEYQEIDDIAYYCERYKDYRCYPLCRKDKSCFKKDKTFQGKLEDLKEFWGERWYE